MKKLPDLPKSLYEEYPAMSAYAHEVAVKEYAQSAMSTISPAVAVESADTTEMQRFVLNSGDMIEHPQGGFVLHVDAIDWGAQQREAGQRYGWGQCATLNQEAIRQQRERADKAEAERNTLKESLRLVNVDHGLWMARTHAAEDARDDALARVKELEERLAELDTQHAAPFGSPIMPTTWR